MIRCSKCCDLNSVDVWLRRLRESSESVVDELTRRRLPHESTVQRSADAQAPHLVDPGYLASLRPGIRSGKEPRFQVGPGAIKARRSGESLRDPQLHERCPVQLRPHVPGVARGVQSLEVSNTVAMGLLPAGDCVELRERTMAPVLRSALEKWTHWNTLTRSPHC